MPLHDWDDEYGWEGMHHLWASEILRSLRSLLPPGYRVLIGTVPMVSVEPTSAKPDVSVTNGHAPPPSAPGAIREPDWEAAVTTATVENEAAVHVERGGRLVAAVELVSPRNKDRPSARELYANRYLTYLSAGAHLLLVDVHRRPINFGFSQLIAADLQADLPTLPAPSAFSYRVGAKAAFGGRTVAVWREPLAVGEPLPTMPLALTPDVAVNVDLDGTYTRAATDCYL